MRKIGVGIIGFQARRSWSAQAHVPALRALPDYEIVAVATTRGDSALAAAQAIGIEDGFDDYRRLIDHPAVDLVVVTVKVPHHREIVEAAIAAGKHVYCEWPLGNGVAEGRSMAAAMRQGAGQGIVGLQGRMSPVIGHVRDLIGSGYVGDVLSTSVIASGMQWGTTTSDANAYTLDRRNGATMLTIPFGHTVDTLCSTLGEFTQVAAISAIRQPLAISAPSGAEVAKNAEDQIAVGGVLAGGAVASIHMRGGMTRGTGFLWEINGTKGDLQLTAPGGMPQIFAMSLSGAQGEQRQLELIPVADQFRWVPKDLAGPAVNVAQLYARFAADLRDGTHLCPDFDCALALHETLAAVEASAEGGVRTSPSAHVEG